MFSIRTVRAVRSRSQFGTALSVAMLALRYHQAPTAKRYGANTRHRGDAVFQQAMDEEFPEGYPLTNSQTGECERIYCAVGRFPRKGSQLS